MSSEKQPFAPSAEEKEAIAQMMVREIKSLSLIEARRNVDEAFIARFDHYESKCAPWEGVIFAIVWAGSPEFVSTVIRERTGDYSFVKR